jgi:sec-independent protein translocase protein TatA
MFGIGTQELVILMAIGLLLFGSRLPEVGRSIGKSIVEFKKGMNGYEDEMERTPHSAARTTQVDPEPIKPPQRLTASSPKFTD